MVQWCDTRDTQTPKGMVQWCTQRYSDRERDGAMMRYSDPVGSGWPNLRPPNLRLPIFRDGAFRHFRSKVMGFALVVAWLAGRLSPVADRPTARAARRLPSIRTRRSGRRSGRSHREVALFDKPRREWMLAAVPPRRAGKVGELRSLRTWPAGRGAYLLSLSAHCLVQ